MTHVTETNKGCASAVRGGILIVLSGFAFLFTLGLGMAGGFLFSPLAMLMQLLVTYLFSSTARLMHLLITYL